MENPARTAGYLATLEERRLALRAELSHAIPSNGRFVWEVGSGHGHFLTSYAEAHPAQTCIGIDISSERIERAMRKRERAALPNLHFLRADVRMFLDLVPPEVRFEAIFILFPDPWPKLRHRKHRILQTEFLARAAPHMDASGRLYFRTDHTDYYNAARAELVAHRDWQLVDEPWPYEFETVFQARAHAYQSLVAGRRP